MPISSSAKLASIGFALGIASVWLDPARAETPVSGEPMPHGDIAGWRQVFADDFRTNVPVGSFPKAVADKWSVYPDGWKGTFKTGLYMPSRVVSIHDGLLDLHLHSEDGVRMDAALLPKIPDGVGKQGGLLYGRYAIRFRADSLPCYKTAWLLWPDSETWPRDGEIDFPEGELDKTFAGFVHHQDALLPRDQEYFPTTASYKAWHTAVIQWEPENLRFFLDGQLIGKSSTHIPDTPMHWVIQTETMPSSCVPVDQPDGHVYIAWVVAYQKK